MAKSILLFSLLLMLVPFFAAGQKRNVIQQEFVWLRYYNKLAISNQWQLHTELDVRWFISPVRQHQWVLPRVHLHYKFSNGVDVAVGSTYFLQALPQSGYQEVDRIRREIRPHQELNLNQQFGRIKVSHRYRIEERFFLKTAAGELPFNFRFRYKFQLQIPLRNEEKQFPVSLELYDEIMFNAGKGIVYNVFDQNRIYTGFVVKLSRSWSTEIGYLNWFQQRSSGQDFHNRHIARIAITHSIILKEN